LKNYFELKVKEKPYVCQYCGHGYTKESTLITHVCEQKRRHLAKDEKHVIIGYKTFIRFFQLTQNSNTTKTYAEFAKSPYYNAFVKFGSYVSNVNPLYPEHYIDWIVKSGVKLDHWCRDELYEKYVLERIHSEQAEAALERSIKTMDDWAKEHNSLWNHYFSYASTSRATYDIKDGKISPWLILNCDSGKKMLTLMNDEQLASISNIISPQVWVKKFKANKFSLQLVKDVVKESNL
jgi:hypothetical protein